MSATPESKAPEMLNIEIDGVPLRAPRGSMIIHAADDAGIQIPRFCYHKKLPIAANCRMCLVEVEKAPKPMPACATPVMEGMKVFTRSARAKSAQRGVMEFLLINHPLDCPICDQGGECELQDVAMGYGKDISRFVEKKRVVKDKNIGPLIATEMTRCIHCTRCIRTLEVVGGVKELGATGRGMHTTIGTYVERSVDSEMSGNVIDVCPVGALTSKPFRFSARAWEIRQHNSIAPHDCLGSNIHVHTYQNRVMRVVPRENESINETWLSDRDRFSYEGLNSSERLLAPMIRVNDAWEICDWDTALDAVAEGLTAVRDAHGAEQIGAWVSPSATTEELYLMQKLMRGFGSGNIDHRLRQGDFSDQQAAPAFPWLGQALQALDELDAVLLIGANIRKQQPIAAHRLLKAERAGCRIMSVNPVDFDFSFAQAEKIITAPAGMVDALAGIALALQELTGNRDDHHLDALLENASPQDSHRAIAAALHEAGNATVLLGPLAEMHPQFAALRALARLINELGGARLGYLPQGGNAAGAWLAGAVPHRGPGGKQARTTGQDFGAMLAGQLKGVCLLGIEPEYDTIDPSCSMTSLEQADFVVVMNSYVTESMQHYADVLLPIAPFTETSGSFVNAEGHWQSFNAVVSAAGESRPGWKVLRVLGNLLDLEGFDYTSSKDIQDELHLAVGDVRPDNSTDITAVPVSRDRADRLQRIAEVPIYSVDAVVRRARALQQTRDAGGVTARMNAAQAETLGFEDGQPIRVRQQAGKWASMPLGIDAAVPDGCVLIPTGCPGTESLCLPFGPIDIMQD